MSLAQVQGLPQSNRFEMAERLATPKDIHALSAGAVLEQFQLSADPEPGKRDNDGKVMFFKKRHQVFPVSFSCENDDRCIGRQTSGAA